MVFNQDHEHSWGASTKKPVAPDVCFDHATVLTVDQDAFLAYTSNKQWFISFIALQLKILTSILCTLQVMQIQTLQQ